MKNLKDIILERLHITKKTKANQDVNSLEELKTKYNLEDASRDNLDRFYNRIYILPDNINKKYYDVVNDRRIDPAITIYNFTKDNNLLERDIFNWIFNYSDTHYYLVLNHGHYASSLMQIIYSKTEKSIRIYISKGNHLSVREINNLDKVAAKVIDYIINY